MDEFEEFAYALLDQLSVELNEENEIKESQKKATEAFTSKIRFDEVEVVCNGISTTYGDFYESVIHLNKFILSSYPKIILYKQGAPYDLRFEQVNSGYMGALKMTVLEEQVHSVQK